MKRIILIFCLVVGWCREHDVWGSAFAVWLGVADGRRSQRIAETFACEYDGLVSRGQIRHLPAGVYWENSSAGRDRYQNGGYWGTPVGVADGG